MSSGVDPVRPGYELVLGATPTPGERVWLTNRAGDQFTYRSRWYQVIRVDDAWLPGHSYLVGFYPESPREIRREYVIDGGVRVERRCRP
ncbi:hypothetical protein [Actinocatenispora sera]|uniref:Uncharacterized protein n=1 Tax=Actinocatenispora sera TaxID=390989 RepID=A0A810L3M1_9ACTN|nr:hypothetical protein [Actinocatenispora sera]BCJ29827.1 hypothetical protein Asera_39350 [Actinocatenispora sera]